MVGAAYESGQHGERMMGPDELILAVNSGSSSLKVGCYRKCVASLEPVLSGTATGIGRNDGHLSVTLGTGQKVLEDENVAETQEQALRRLADALQEQLPGRPVAIGHRVVHGGPKLREHQPITPEVFRALEDAVHLAPLHIPQALTLIRATERLYPSVPQFACFDTAFHRDLPDVAKYLPIPRRYFDRGVQRYGFHGLSCESVMRRLGTHPPHRLVIAHLGNGSSLTAVRNGVSVDTSMGLSPTGGIPMGTRTGDLDPGVLLYLLRTEKLTPDRLERFVDTECGLAGLSGGESDMQMLLERSDRRDAAAVLAIDSFCTAVRKQIGSYAALLGGLDLIVFTGGIGEHSPRIRQQITEGLNFLFSDPAQVAISALPAQEEDEIARHCLYLLERRMRLTS